MSVMSLNYEHIWRISDGFYMGSYATGMTKSGLSYDGTYLMTILPGFAGKLYLKKICPQEKDQIEQVKDIRSYLSREPAERVVMLG